MKSNKRMWWTISAITVALLIGIVIGNFISGKSFGRKLFLTPNNKINVVLDIINEDYVDPVNMKDITEGAIRNIIGELDPHSIYIPGDALPGVNDDMEGYFGGIGVEDYFLHGDTIVLITLTHGGPASQSGLLPGDRIIKVNDSVFIGPGITDEKIMKVLRGPVGSMVKLTIQRKDWDKPTDYNIKRSEILIPTVTAAYEVEKGIGFIKIEKFSHTTYDEFVQAMTKLVSKGSSSFIVDLRMNSGGSYDAAIQVINEFLPAGRPIVYAQGKSFPRVESVSDGKGNLPDNPLVILMDQMSASASEIVAGAIQDNDRGLIIGRRSFGKGLVQNQIELSDGSAVRLTIARYYTPSGRNIQRKYELGKSIEYNREWINQFNGESFFADSVKIDTTEVFKTLHGRTVYGNGGIMPDIFIPVDTVHLSNYYFNLENKHIFNKFAFEYTENNREVLSKFKDYPAMLEYLKTQPLFFDMIRFAEENGVKKRTHQINRSANQILLTTYACILNNFFGEEIFYQVYLSNDPMIARSIQAIRKGEAYPKAVAGMKYKN